MCRHSGTALAKGLASGGGGTNHAQFDKVGAVANTGLPPRRPVLRKANRTGWPAGVAGTVGCRMLRPQ
jgi:hypothetical protein